MATWAFYSDSALGTAYTELSCTQTTSTFRVWFGSTSTGRQLIAQSTGAQIYVIPADSTTGGHSTSAIKIAASTGALAATTGGASFALGTSVLGGAVNAEEFYVRVTDAVGNGIKSTELSLALTACYETAT
jgi:hypothetical protein